MVLNERWLFVSLPLALAALVLIALTARSLVRTTRNSVVLSLRVVSEQAITFSDAGPYVLNVEGTSFSRVASGLRFSIEREGTAAPVPLSAILVRTKVSSFSKTRLELYRFEIPAAGRYTLRVDGSNPETASGNAAIVITRSFTLAMVLHVLALVALGGLFIGSLVVTGLVFAKPA